MVARLKKSSKTSLSRMESSVITQRREATMMHANTIIVSVAHLMTGKVSNSNSKRNISRTVIFIEQNNKLIISIKEGKKNIKGGITGHRRKSSIEEPKRHSTNSSNSKDKKGTTETTVDLIRMILDSIMNE